MLILIHFTGELVPHCHFQRGSPVSLMQQKQWSFFGLVNSGGGEEGMAFCFTPHAKVFRFHWISPSTQNYIIISTDAINYINYIVINLFYPIQFNTKGNTIQTGRGKCNQLHIVSRLKETKTFCPRHGTNKWTPAISISIGIP